MGYTAVPEGKPLKYSKGEELIKKTAHLPDGSECAYWARTPNLWETYTVFTIGWSSLGSGTTEIYSGVRLAFYINKQAIIKKSSTVIEGETVYVIE